MRIIGIDPGINRTGYGVLDFNSQEFSLVEYGSFTPDIKEPTYDRLASICDKLKEVLARTKPDTAVVEDLFFSKNARSALTLGHIRGALIVTLSNAGLRIRELTPLEIKKGLTGYGRAEKPQVGEMVRIILGLKEIPAPADASDALAAAIAYSLKSDFENRTSSKSSG
jgi:crossover junction endodeoxyribonuclease RuvC